RLQERRDLENPGRQPAASNARSGESGAEVIRATSQAANYSLANIERTQPTRLTRSASRNRTLSRRNCDAAHQRLSATQPSSDAMTPKLYRNGTGSAETAISLCSNSVSPVIGTTA